MKAIFHVEYEVEVNLPDHLSTLYPDRNGRLHFAKRAVLDWLSENYDALKIDEKRHLIYADISPIED